MQLPAVVQPNLVPKRENEIMASVLSEGRNITRNGIGLSCTFVAGQRMSCIRDSKGIFKNLFSSGRQIKSSISNDAFPTLPHQSVCRLSNLKDSQNVLDITYFIPCRTGDDLSNPSSPSSATNQSNATSENQGISHTISYKNKVLIIFLYIFLNSKKCLGFTYIVYHRLAWKLGALFSLSTGQDLG